MQEKKKSSALITSKVFITNDIVSMWIKEETIAQAAKPGQFISLYTDDKSKLLPRPISICEIDKEQGLLRLVFRIVGFGTEEFSKKNSGDQIEVLGPLGNGFEVEGEKALCIGGGIGIPPMLELSKQLSGETTIVLGYRDECFMNQEFEQYGNVYCSTEDGSFGTKGNVIDCIRENNIQADVIYACGPTPMLRGIKAYALENNIKAYLSLEEKMACGIGACLACVCQTKEKDHHSNVNNKRICKDGPVFLSTEVEL